MEVKVLGSPLYQWEMGRKIKITPPANTKVDRVDFSRSLDSDALPVIPYDENGVIVANIPNVLLQSGDPIFVYLVYCGEDCVETTASYVLSVIKRPKPADYVYTETEVKAWESLEQRIKVLESGGASPDAIENAVKEYLEEHPIEVGTAPNPHKLTFSGAVQGEYDGSEPLNVEIPVVGNVVTDEHITLSSMLSWG